MTKHWAVLFLLVLSTHILAEQTDVGSSKEADSQTTASEKINQRGKEKDETQQEEPFVIHRVFEPKSKGQKGLNHAFLNAVKDNDVDSVRFTIASGADTKAKDDNGSTALHLAAERGLIHIARELIQRDPNLVHAQNNEGSRPMHSAALHGHVKVLQLLLDSGAHVNDCDVYGATPLHCAAFRDRSMLAKSNSSLTKQKSKDVAEDRFILSRGGDGSRADKHNATALHIAGYTGNKVMATILIKEGVPVNAQNRDGNTALHEASYNGHGHTAREMLLLGADMEIENDAGQRAEDIWCACNQNPTIVCEKSCLPKSPATDEEKEGEKKQ